MSADFNRYDLYGMTIATSSNLPLCSATGSKGGRELIISLGELPQIDIAQAETPVYASGLRNDRGEPLLRIGKLPEHGYYHLNYADGTEFYVDYAATRVWGVWIPPYTIDDAITYLIGPVLGFVLHLRGVVTLHASAIIVNGQAVGLIGDGGAGKSSLAAAFVQSGYQALTDDVLAIESCENEMVAHHGFPRLRLWPDSANTLFGSDVQLPRITPNWDKRHLELTSEKAFFPEKARLSAVYLLDPSNEAQTVKLTLMPAKSAFLTLLENKYVTTCLNNAMRTIEFEYFTELARTTPFYRAVWNPSEGPFSVRDAILNDRKTIQEKVLLSPLN